MPEPGSPEWQERAAKLLDAEMTQPLSWWYLSFASESGFLGAVLVRARGFVSAHRVVHVLNLSPGGEVQGYELGPTLPPAVTTEMICRLLTREELEALDAPST